MNEPVEGILMAARKEADAEHKAGFQLGRAHPAGGVIPPRVFIFYAHEAAGIFSTFRYGEGGEAYEMAGNLYEDQYGMTPEQKAAEVLENSFDSTNNNQEFDLLAAGADEIVDEVLESATIPDNYTILREETEHIP
jgi:hypothetical protein